MLTLIVAGLASAVALPVIAAKQGEKAPEFIAEASLAGKSFQFSLKDALSKGPVVVYFYPSAYTPGCNIQAREFATKMDKFTAAKATVVGVSMDNIARLNDFSADPAFCAGKVPVASDVGGHIAKSFGLKSAPETAGAKDTRGIEIGHGFTERTTFVISKDGKIAATISGVAPDKNVAAALTEVEKIAAKKK